MAAVADIGGRVAGLSVLVLVSVLTAVALYIAGGTPFTAWVNGVIA